MPASCFGQTSSEYIGNQLVTTFMIDGDMTIVNEHDDVHAVAVEEKTVVMSAGTAGFIASMEHEDDSDNSNETVFEVATTAELARFKK